MKNSIVLDCSAALAWLLPDEVTKESLGLLQYIRENGAVVPSLWSLEVANSLLMSLKKKRIDDDYRHKAVKFIDDLPIRIDEYTTEYALTKTLELAEKYKLTVYDATYLELALRLKYPLATKDQELIKAAHKCKIKII